MGSGASSRIRDGLMGGDKLEKMAHACDGLFEDDEFDPMTDDALMGPRFLQENPGMTDDDIYWLRPSEFGPGTLYRSGAQALDCTACVGALDSCNKDLSVVLQALCARRPDYVMDMIVSYNAVVGCAAIRLYHNGRMEVVVVDDRLPCRIKVAPLPGQPPHQFAFEPISCRLTTGECWLPLIEKALAKLHGAYTATALGDGCRELFRDLCGGDHVLDINLARMGQEQLATLFSTLYPRFLRNELVMVARKSHTCSRTWAQKQRCSSVFNLVLHDDSDGTAAAGVNAFGADISNNKTNKAHREDEFAHTIGHCVDQHGDFLVEHVYASAANTDSQSVPKALFADVMQQPQLLSRHFDETKAAEVWDERRFFVCLSEDEAEPTDLDMAGLHIAHDLTQKIQDAQEHQLARSNHDGAAATDASGTGATDGPAEPVFGAYEAHSPQWMSWKMFCEDYEQLVVCVVASDGHCCRRSPGVDVPKHMGVTMQSAWDPRHGTAGGGQHLKTWRNSPLFRVRLKEFKPCRGRLLITTSLPDARKEAYFGDAIPDLAQWDGTQYHGGSLLYPAHAVFVCQDEPTLTNIVVNTDYSQQRDVTVEMDLDLRLDGPFSFVVVPCTYADEIRSEFYLSATFFADDGERLQVEIDILEEWGGYNYTAKVGGQWLKGQTAMGAVSKHNQFSFLNPAWKIVIAGPHAADDEDNFDHSLVDAGGAGAGVSTVMEGNESLGFVDASVERRDEAIQASAFQGSVVSIDKLTYEDVHELNQSSHISVPSNDTGPYSKSRIRRKDDKPSVRYFQICCLLSPSTEMHGSSRGNSPANSRPGSADTSALASGMDPTQHRLPRSGTYLMTPNAYSKLLHNRGECGDQHVHDGYLGKFRFNAYPVTSRHEKFCIFNGGVNGSSYLHRGSDVYDEMICMPALNDKGTEGSFNLEIMCNLPFRLEPVELGCVPAPLKDVMDVRASVMSASRSAKMAAMASRMSATALARSSPLDRTNDHGALAVTINDNNGPVNLDRDAQNRAGETQGLSDAPSAGVGITNMPSFERGVITDTIDATSREEEGPGSVEVPALLAKKEREAPVSIRAQMGSLKMSLATQIREDTDRRLNAISISMWSNEHRLQAATKRQYEEEAERERLGLPKDEGTYGGTVYFQPLLDRSGGMMDK